MKEKIIKFDHLGNGIARSDNKVIFVKRALKDEVVEIKIIEDKNKYQKAEIVNVIEANKSRINPICPYYDECGGCNFLHSKNDVEILFKKEKATELLGSNIKFYDTKEFNYRNKVTLHVKDNKIGFYHEKTNDIIDIDYCYLLNEKINSVLKELNYYLKNNDCEIKEVVIRATNESMMIIDGKINNNFIKHFSFVDTIINNNKVIKGKGYIEEEILNYNFRISPKSFFQVNKIGLEKIFEILKNNLNNHYEKALDLYSGTSVMGILISSFCKKVISVEVNRNATDDALINKLNNNVNNLLIINDKVENCIDSLSDVDLIVVDPPRSGLDKKTVSYLNKIKPKTIVYISCNMITLKRDLECLLKDYSINNIDLVNMFPKTYHVETVCILNYKQGI